MEIVKYFGIILILNVSCSHNNLLVGQHSENELTKYIKSKLYQGIKNQNCTDFLDTISSFYFSSEINNGFSEINTAIDSLQIYNEKHKFIKKRTSDGCLSSYYALLALKYSSNFVDQSNELRISKLFEELRKKNTNNEVFGPEYTLLNHLFDKYTYENFLNIFNESNTMDKELIFRIVVKSSNYLNSSEFINKLDFDKLSPKINEMKVNWEKTIWRDNIKLNK